MKLKELDNIATIHAIQLKGEIVWQKNSKIYDDEIPEQYLECEVCYVEPFVQATVNKTNAITRARLKVIVWE